MLDLKDARYMNAKQVEVAPPPLKGGHPAEDTFTLRACLVLDLH